MMTNLRKFSRALTALTLTATLAAAAPTLAGDDDGCHNPRDRKGWLVGLNVGSGSSSYGASVGSRTYTEDAYSGEYGGLRGGYAFSNAFAVTLEGVGFGSSSGDRDWGMGAGLVAVTWWPAGGGFFVRGGLGGGGGEVLLRESGEVAEFSDRAAGLFGIGYEWQVGRNFALGLAADGFGFDIEGITGETDAFVGTGSFSIQFNWYL